jgi:hypothetical protein
VPLQVAGERDASHPMPNFAAARPPVKAGWAGCHANGAGVPSTFHPD